MATGKVNQGTWMSKSQGAWQVQAQQHSATLTDSMTGADALSAEADKVKADSMTGSDKAISVWADLNGTSEYFYRSDADFPESGIHGAHDLTIQAWIKPDIAAGSHAIASKYQTLSNKRMFMFWTQGDELALSISSDGATYTVVITSGDFVEAGKWMHAVVVYDASAGTADFYKNGVFVEHKTGLPTSIADKSPPFSVGAFTTAYFYDGGISNVCLFDDKRTPDEIETSFGNKFEDISSDANCIGQWMFDDAAAANFIDNLQGDAGRDLIPYDGGDTTFGNCGRTTGREDDVVADASVVLADSMTGVDALSGEHHGEVGLADSMTGSDAVAKEAEAGLADSMTGVDALSGEHHGEVGLADTMTGADAVVSAADVQLPGSGFTNVGHIDDGEYGLGIWGDGTYIYLANHVDGLRAYTFNGATFTNVGHIDNGGLAWGVWGDGTYIYLANSGDGLRAYTFDGSTFTCVGHIDDGGEGLSVWGDGTYIYLANHADGLRAYTFDGSTFTNVGHIDEGGSGYGVWGDGTYIYLANHFGGLRAYTFNGATFTNVGHIDDGGEAWGVWGDGTYIYLANDTDGLRAYTFNGTTFTNVGHIDDGGEGLSVWGDGTFIYLANAVDGLRAYTFDGSTFVNVGHINNGGEARFVWGDGACLYLANHADGLRAYTFPVISEIMEGSDALSGEHHGEVSLADSMTGAESIVQDAEVHVFGSIFVNVGHINDGGSGLGVWVNGTYIYLANEYDGLRAYTFDGSTFTNVGHIDDGGQGWNVWGDGTYIYLANHSDGLRAYTFDGSTFVNVGHVSFGGHPWCIGVWGDGVYIYGAWRGDGLRAYTFDGSTFVEVGHIDDGGVAYGVWGDGTYIYLANGSGGLRAYTFDGATFTGAGHIDDGGIAYDVWGDGTYIYLANYSDGLRAYTFDGSTFTNVGHIDDGGSGWGVWGDGTYIYLANLDDGLRVYTFNGSTFVNVFHVDDGGRGWDVRGDGTYIYLANYDDGLRAYAFQDDPEAMEGSDVLSGEHHGEVSLADSATGSDAIAADAEIALADASAVAESLSADADGGLADGMSPSDALAAEAGITFSDSMTGIDALTGAGHGEVLLADIAICPDELTVVAAPSLADSMTGVDALSGHVGPGLLPGLGNEAPHTIDAGSKQPRQRRETITNRRRQLTAVTISSANTTFGKLTVTDASAWDLSEVERHYIVVTADGYIGEVESVAGNTVTIRGWIKSNINRHGIAEDKPDDDALVVVFKTIRARRVLISVDPANTKPVYLGFNRDVDLGDGHPISRHLSKENSSLTIEAGLGKWLNLTKFWLVAGSEQVVRWQTETFVGGDG